MGQKSTKRPEIFEINLKKKTNSKKDTKLAASGQNGAKWLKILNFPHFHLLAPEKSISFIVII